MRQPDVHVVAVPRPDPASRGRQTCASCPATYRGGYAPARPFVGLAGMILAMLAVLPVVCLPAAPTTGMEAGGLRTYAACGLVERVGLEQHQVTIHHRAIPDFMPEMTMDFEVKNTNELKGLLPGSEVRFNLVVLPDAAWIERIEVTGRRQPPSAHKPGPAVGSIEPELKAGDPWPDGEFLAQDGRRLRFSDFRGQTLALTFFFTRCPLPDFCQRLNRDFADARRLLSAASSASTNYMFLSLSFDPDFDTAEQLANYARFCRGGDPGHWLFGAALPATLQQLPRRLGLRVERQGAGFLHNLRTIVIDEYGRVYRQFDGNDWTPQELAEAVQAASQARQSQ
jgi:protein SCO1